MAESITVSRILPAKAERLFKAWLSGEEHSAMTGSAATHHDDGQFTAWDGYISGKTVETEPSTRILQHWRTTGFPPDAPDSHLEILFSVVDGGTEVTLNHTNLPEGQGEGYAKGWLDNYFDPMDTYFGSARARLQQASEAVVDAAEGAKAAVTDAAEQVSDAVESAAKQAQVEALKVAKTVRRTAKSASTQVKKATAAVKKAAGRAGKSGRALVANVRKALTVKAKAIPKKAKPAAAKAKAKVKALPARSAKKAAPSKSKGAAPKKGAARKVAPKRKAR